MMSPIQNSPLRMPRRSPRLRRPGGFTLLEMMIVLSIIALLLGTAIFYMTGDYESAQDRRAEADISQISIQLKGYQMDNNFMPTTEQGLMALVKEPTSDPVPRRWRQWLEKLPVDPWGMPYVYRNPGIHNPNGFDLYSYGPAKKENDREIGNWDNNNDSGRQSP